MPQDFYAEVAPIYDRMIRWERRLKVEEPLFAELWRRTGARTVLDASCGSGRHLVLFTRQGRTATGSDASPEMLALARAQVAALPEAERPPLIESTWEQLPQRVPDAFEAVLCLGNSLPYVTDPAARRASLAGLWSRVAPGGFLLIQFRNFTRMRAAGEKFLPLSQTIDRESNTEYVCLRQYEWHEATVDFNVMILSRPLGDPEAAWALRHWTTPLATLAAEDPAAPLRELGAEVTLHGSLALEPYDPTASDDTVIFARRAS
jgi:SAM-dependent methyltransferase